MENLSSNQARLQDDLRGLARGDARCDDVVLQLYSFDGGPFQERPSAVVWPRCAEDVAAVMTYAAEKGLSVHARGAGTSGVAAAIGSGIILDFSRYMRRTLHAGEDFVRVQPGAVRERVNDQLRASKGRFFAPSSGHIPTSTLGSILSVDNIGPRWLRYGAPHESALMLKVASATGAIWELRPYPARAEALFSHSRREYSFRRAFLNASRAEANAVASRAETTPTVDAPTFDADFASELRAAPFRADAEDFGTRDGEDLRFFDSEFARDLFFRRAFGRDANEVRTLVAREPWASALKIAREYEPYFDAEQRTTTPLRCGYALRDVVRAGFDPTRFFTGSEGTLGIIVEATLASTAIAPFSGAAILLFESLDQASRAALGTLAVDPTLCDLLDSRVISLTRDWDSRFESIFPQGAQAALVVELDDESDARLRARMDELQRRARERWRSFGGWTAYAPEDRALFRELLQKSSCARLRMAPSFQSFPFWEDVRIPVEAAPDFLREVQELCKRERIVYSVGGHIGCGCLSVQPILPYSEDETRRAVALSDEFENLALRCGGEIGATKGNGRVRTAAIPKRFPKLFPAFVKIKDLFDPDARLNPDCVVSPEMRRMASCGTVPESPRVRTKTPTRNDPDDDEILAPEADAALRESSLHSRSIKRREPFDLERLERELKIEWLNRPERSQFEFQIAWNPTFVYAPTFQCVGCGRCRIRTSETRLCPAFRYAPDEQASCRAKANLLRGALDGDLPLDALARDQAHKIGEHCIRCHSCASECPAQVDAARLAFRLRSARVAANGLSAAELNALRMERALSVASRVAPAINAALRSRALRWILEKTLGLAQGRALPLFARRSYLSRVPTRARIADELDDALRQTPSDEFVASATRIETPRVALLAKRRKVALWIDSYANYFDPALVEAATGVLERNEIDVRVLRSPLLTGQIAFAIGDLDRSEEIATRNISILREAMRDGSEIVALEPTAAVCLKKEYPYFCDDADARAVCDATSDFCSMLARLARDGAFDVASMRPLSSETVKIGYHAPCRSLALSGAAVAAPTAAQRLLETIPNVSVERLERGCCGLGGFSGMTTTRFAESVRLGTRLFLAMRHPDIQVCASECSFCNLQLAQGARKPVAHVVKLLAAAYGLTTLASTSINVARPPRRERKKF